MGDLGLSAQMRRRGVRDERTLQAISALNRRDFVPEHPSHATADYPLPIGYGQTISQPYIVALMTEALALKGEERVLEIGSGSGYQTALLSLLAKDVFSLEIIEALHVRAARVLSQARFSNVILRHGDGFRGWPERAPFDAILLTAAPPSLPAPLLDQLALGGRLVGPVGANPFEQDLVLITKHDDGTLSSELLLPVRFVPMVSQDMPGALPVS